MNKRLNESSRFMSDTSGKIAERESVKRFSTAPLNTVSHGQPNAVEVPMHRHTARVIRCNSLIYVSKQRHENITLTFDTFTDNGKTFAGKSSDGLSSVNDDEKKSKPVMKCDIAELQPDFSQQ